jgi:hypothetical protein
VRRSAGSDERDEASRERLTEEDPEEDQYKSTDLLHGERFTGDHGPEQDTGHRVE